MSEPIREQPVTPAGEGSYRRDVSPQPLRPVQNRPTVREVEASADLVHWGPTWAGVFIPIALLLMLAPLGVAIGLSSGTGAAIWGVISLIVAFAVGGWVVGRTLSFDEPLIAGAHGLLAWAVALSLLLLTTAVLGVFGTAAAVPGPGGLPNVVVPTNVVFGASLGTFVALLISACAAIAGAVVGNQSRAAAPRAY